MSDIIAALTVEMLSLNEKKNIASNFTPNKDKITEWASLDIQIKALDKTKTIIEKSMKEKSKVCKALLEKPLINGILQGDMYCGACEGVLYGFDEEYCPSCGEFNSFDNMEVKK